jgi:hypothetical protein
MRKTLTLLLGLMLSATAASSQIWLEMGLKGMMGMTGFQNKNLAGDSRFDQQLGLANSVGGVLGLNFGDYHGLNVEALSATHHQSFTFRSGDGQSDAVNIKWKSTDMYFLYRWYRDNGAFLELGPKTTFVRGAQQALGTDWNRVNDQYSKTYYSAVLGVGGFVVANEILAIKTGIRAEYAMTDLVSETGRANGYPAPFAAFERYEETRPFRLGMYLELTFGVGGLAQSMCGDRGFIFGSAYK